jgi:hypothetical protein
VSSHTPETIAAASQVPADVRENIRQLVGCAIAWPRIAVAVGLPEAVVRCIAGRGPERPPAPSPPLPWHAPERQLSLFE